MFCFYWVNVQPACNQRAGQAGNIISPSMLILKDVTRPADVVTSAPPPPRVGFTTDRWWARGWQMVTPSSRTVLMSGSRITMWSVHSTHTITSRRCNLVWDLISSLYIYQCLARSPMLEWCNERIIELFRVLFFVHWKSFFVCNHTDNHTHNVQCDRMQNKTFKICTQQNEGAK